ncbi:MAG: hypothetical protein QW806_09635 [Nitrososphaerota archaeon]
MSILNYIEDDKKKERLKDILENKLKLNQDATLEDVRRKVELLDDLSKLEVMYELSTILDKTDIKNEKYVIEEFQETIVKDGQQKTISGRRKVQLTEKDEDDFYRRVCNLNHTITVLLKDKIKRTEFTNLAELKSILTNYILDVLYVVNENKKGTMYLYQSFKLRDLYMSSEKIRRVVDNYVETFISSQLQKRS